MPFYIGTGVLGQPGFKMKEFEGFDTSPNGKYWGSGPINDDGILLAEIEGMNRKQRREYTRRNKI